MTEARKAKAPPAKPPHNPPPRKKRRHLEGIAYYVIYVPALIVASISALLFVAAVERYFYEDD